MTAMPARPRLVATDLDGTLLDAEGQIPSDFWPLLERMRTRASDSLPHRADSIRP